MLKALIVTVAYNPTKSVMQNLEIDYYPHLVVDNSECETIWLKEYCQLVGHFYQWMGDNLGIAKALNVGAEYAMNHGYDYIVTMDQDSCLTESLLFNMAEKINNFRDMDKVAIFSPKHVLYALQFENPRQNNYSENIAITMTSGNWVNLKLWQDLGGFNESLFIDGVDMEYYLRAKISNYKVITFLNIFLKHNLGNSLRNYKVFHYQFDVSNHSAIRRYYMVRNYLFIIFKYRSYFEKIPELKIYCRVLVKLPIIVLLFESEKYIKLKYMVLGCIDFLLKKYEKRVF